MLLIVNFSFKKSILFVLIFLSSFIVIDGTWTIRNYFKTNEFVPLASTMKYHTFMNKALLEHMLVCENIGYSFDFKGWFNNENDLRCSKDIFPLEFLPNKKSIEIMDAAKKEYWLSIDNSLSEFQKAKHEQESLLKQSELLSSYLKKYPFTWFFSRLKILHIMLTPSALSLYPSCTILNNLLKTTHYSLLTTPYSLLSQLSL